MTTKIVWNEVMPGMYQASLGGIFLGGVAVSRKGWFKNRRKTYHAITAFKYLSLNHSPSGDYDTLEEAKRWVEGCVRLLVYNWDPTAVKSKTKE